ncbi:MAG: glycosyltransferase family 39 protein [Candidatus Altiarchaeota archaeon]
MPKKFTLSMKHGLYIVLLWSLVIRLVFFVGLNWSDDVGYVFDAYRSVVLWQYPAHNLAALRIGHIFPIGFFFKVFGVSTLTAVLFPFICSMGEIVIVYYLGGLLFDKKTGLIAAFLLSFYPLDVLYATWIMPDVPVSFVLGLSVFLTLVAEKKGLRVIWEKKISSPAKKVKKEIKLDNYLYFLSGLLVGWAYLMRISGLIGLLFFVPYFTFDFLKKRRLSVRPLLFVLGLLFVMNAESVFYYLEERQIEDFYLRHTVITGFYHGETRGINPDLSFYPSRMFNVDNNLKFEWNARYHREYGLFFYAIIPAFIYILVFYRRRAYPILLWITAFFSYLELGSMSLTEYVPIHHLPRYLTVISIPAMLILAYALGLNLKSSSFGWRKACVSLIVLMLFSSSLFFLYHQHRFNQVITKGVKDSYHYLKNQPVKRIYADSGTAGALSFYFGFKRKDTILSINENVACSGIQDAYVVTDSSKVWMDCRHFLLEGKDKIDPPSCGGLPTCYYWPPREWELIASLPNPQDVSIYQSGDTRIYYAPPK